MMTNEEFIAKLRELKEFKLMAEELVNQITSLEDEIKAEMTARNVKELIVDIFKIKWVTCTISRIDTTTLKNELPDIAAKYVKTIEMRRLLIT